VLFQIDAVFVGGLRQFLDIGSFKMPNWRQLIARSSSPECAAEEYLVQKAQNGCIDSRNTLIERHADRLRRFVIRITLASPDGDDVFQQTIYKAIKKLHQFRHDSSFFTWLCSIAVNEIRQLKRKQRSMALFPLDDGYLNLSLHDQEYRSPLELCCHAERNSEVRRAVNALPPHFRAVIELRDFQEHSIQDTATLLQVSVSAIKSRHLRAQRSLAGPRSLLRRQRSRASRESECQK
jgi:RNA polymerase sigma-70 factor (ECF subfamily)